MMCPFSGSRLHGMDPPGEGRQGDYSAACANPCPAEEYR
jgi:hypothetical protein